jgi:hypothetical protein
MHMKMKWLDLQQPLHHCERSQWAPRDSSPNFINLLGHTQQPPTIELHPMKEKQVPYLLNPLSSGFLFLAAKCKADSYVWDSPLESANSLSCV